MRSFTLLAGATMAMAQCDTDGWCNFGDLDAHYSCPTPGPQCLESKISKTGMHNEYVKLTYVAPALIDGTKDPIEFIVDPSGIIDGQFADADEAFFTLATGLGVENMAEPAGYLLVMQGVSFNAFESSNISTPEIPGIGAMEICWGATTSAGKCESKAFAQHQYKFSFAAYQVAPCDTPDDCHFFLRTQVDTTNMPADAPIFFNGDAAMTVDKVATGVANAVSSFNIGDQFFQFPTGVNVNNDNFLQAGCTVHLEEKPANGIMKLAFRVKAPGVNKFVMYDPDVSYKSTSDQSGAATTGGTDSTDFSAAPVAVSASLAALLVPAFALLL